MNIRSAFIGGSLSLLAGTAPMTAHAEGSPRGETSVTFLAPRNMSEIVLRYTDSKGVTHLETCPNQGIGVGFPDVQWTYKNSPKPIVTSVDPTVLCSDGCASPTNASGGDYVRLDTVAQKVLLTTTGHNVIVGNVVTTGLDSIHDGVGRSTYLPNQTTNRPIFVMYPGSFQFGQITNNYQVNLGIGGGRNSLRPSRGVSDLASGAPAP